MALYDVSTTEKKTSPELVAGGTLYADSPIGTILPYGGATAPSGWFLCQGQAVSRTTYSELFAVIGTAFGSGDGSTTFNLPDMRGKVPVGFNTNETEFSALGNTGGEKTHTLTVSEIASHNHALTNVGVTSIYQGGGGDVYNCLVGKTGENYATSSRGGGEAHNNLQPYNTVNYIIKAKMTAVPSDFISAVDEAVDEVYGDIIPSDASASNKLVTQDNVSNVIQGIIPMSESSSVIGDITFGVDADGNYGYYKVGADTVTPFKAGGIQLVESITNNSSYTLNIDCTSLTDYSSKTSDNFIIDVKEYKTSWTLNNASASSSFSYNITKSYDPNTGILTLSKLGEERSSSSRTITTIFRSFDVYCY